MAYNSADPWFTMRQGRGLECGLGKVLECDRAEALKAAGRWLRMRFGQSFRMRQARGLQYGRVEQEVQ